MGFDYTFMYPSDEVYVAYTVPYTVTQLNSHLKQLRLLSDESRKFNYSSLYAVSINIFPMTSAKSDSSGKQNLSYPILPLLL